MDELLSKLSELAKQALEDKNFDPAKLEALMAAFGAEADACWAAADATADLALERAHASMREAEAELNAVLCGTVELAEKDLEQLARAGQAAEATGKYLGVTAEMAARQYAEAALFAATSVARNPKVFPAP
ncbi:hypothetical protein AMTR_s00037p00156620 [Amborella trichopoda]|uniref:Uncharacterized protein n=2 Tax=Amborella trichopoda TaxID=13333 RepID=U5CVK7_AMBTC|nr:hypothetical protein AMTR_s00037p00156620 [Amborella trichopoda]